MNHAAKLNAPLDNGMSRVFSGRDIFRKIPEVSFYEA